MAKLGFPLFEHRYIDFLGLLKEDGRWKIVTKCTLTYKITGITEHALLIAVGKIASRYDVVNIGCGGVDAVNQPQRIIDTNVHLHAKMPLVAFLGWCISGDPTIRSRSPLSFFVQLRAEIIVTSKMLPSRSLRPAKDGRIIAYFETNSDLVVD